MRITFTQRVLLDLLVFADQTEKDLVDAEARIENQKSNIACLQREVDGLKQRLLEAQNAAIQLAKEGGAK